MIESMPASQEAFSILEDVIGLAAAVADDLRHIPAALRLQPLLSALTEGQRERLGTLMTNRFVRDAVVIAMRDLKNNPGTPFADIRSLFGWERDAFDEEMWRELRREETRALRCHPVGSRPRGCMR